MNFHVSGTGDISLIFLHGWGQDYTSFLFLDSLIFGKKYYANLDGFGGEPITESLTIPDYAQKLRDYIVKNNLTNVILVGHSFGGRIAIEYASKYSVRALILVDSAGIKPKFSLKKWLKIKKYKLYKFLASKKIIGLDKLDGFGSDDYKAASPVLKSVLKSAVNYDQTSILKNINAKTLIVFGKNDKQTPIYMAKKLNKNIANSMLKILPGGHFCFLDCPLDFAKIIDDFLKNI